MSNIFNTLRIWVVRRADTVYVMAPGDTGMPEPVQEPASVYRAAYLSPDEISDRLERGNVFLDPPNGLLLVRTGDSEAPPAASAMIFTHVGDEQIHCRIGNRPHQFTGTKYHVSDRDHRWAWNNDLIQGKYGYFQIGMKGQANLWRVHRAEADFADRNVFTIAPVLSSNGLPTLDLSPILNDTIRQQIQQPWTEFSGAYIRQLPYRTVNAAKDICEFLLCYVLQRAGTPPLKNFGLGDLLKQLHVLLEDSNNKDHPFAFLHFHLMQKIRILHGNIHASKVTKNGPINPELAFSVVDDLIEVLTSAGLTRT